MFSPKLIASLLLFFSCSSLSAQQCPPNIDFELGNFNYWLCKTGTVDRSTGLNDIVWDVGGNDPSTNRHEIIGPNVARLDPYGHFPIHSPNGSGYCIRLGNDVGTKEAEALCYTFTIPANEHHFSLLYYYAAVIQKAPLETHSEDGEPRFIARIIDLSTQWELNCASFNFIASGSLPGFKTGLNQFGKAARYKTWTPVTVDLSKYSGKTLRLEFITEDCALESDLGHFAYAYIDLGSLCNGAIEGRNYCIGDTAVSLAAPTGFQSYQWYSDMSFSHLIDTTRKLTVNPNQVGATIPVIVSPFQGFGCLDTLVATIGIFPKPSSTAGPDKTVCYKQEVQLGLVGDAAHSYIWQPSGWLVNSTMANPFTARQLQGTTRFIVKTVDLSTDCFAFDTVAVTPILVDTATFITGKTLYCKGEDIHLSLASSSAVDQVQWYWGDQAISGATNFSYQPTNFGKYWALLHQYGCFDSTRFILVARQPTLGVNFRFNTEAQCPLEPITFTNISNILGNGLSAYLWKFDDGTISADINAQKKFNTVGIHSVKLVGELYDCKDSIEKLVTILKDCLPLVPSGFTPNGDGRNDKLVPFYAGVRQFKKFAVYNRYGRIVFSSTIEGAGWDGSVNGREAAADIYIWVLEYLDHEGKAQVKKGTVALIR